MRNSSKALNKTFFACTIHALGVISLSTPKTKNSRRDPKKMTYMKIANDTDYVSMRKKDEKINETALILKKLNKNHNERLKKFQVLQSDTRVTAHGILG